MHRIVTAAAVCALLAAAPVRAQEAAPDTTPRTSLQTGAWSLAFDLPMAVGGTSRLGAWKMVSPRTNVGVSLLIETRDNETRFDSVTATDKDVHLELGVEAKRYFSPAAEVTPFATGGLFGILGRREEDDSGGYDDQRFRGAGVHAGAGVEWFPVRRISLSGHTGVRLITARNELNGRYDGDTREARTEGTAFNTFTSRLSLQIYF